jgi:hypothetical protein
MAAPPLGVSENEVVVSVVVSMALENVAVTVVDRATLVAALPGDVDVTDSGGGAVAHVVNDHDTALASGTPSEAVIEVESRAV